MERKTRKPKSTGTAKKPKAKTSRKPNKSQNKRATKKTSSAATHESTDNKIYIRNYLASIYPRNKKQEIKVPYEEFEKMLTMRQNGHGYNHLTTWSKLGQMLTPVDVPDDSKQHLMLHLGGAVFMNDKNDERCGKNVFFISLFYGPTENISMWTNYGIPNNEAVRIKFSNKYVQPWIKKFRAGKIGVYGVKEDGSLVALSQRPEVKLVQVAYWSKKKTGPRHENPNEGLFFYNSEKYRLSGQKDINAWMAKQPYLFKEYGWDYEREVRLVLIFNEDLADQYKRVAVTFDAPFNDMVKNFTKYVKQGPWYGDKSPKTLVAGHALSEAKPSDFKGFVKMRSVCHCCPNEKKDHCDCPFKDQR